MKFAGDIMGRRMLGDKSKAKKKKNQFKVASNLLEKFEQMGKKIK